MEVFNLTTLFHRFRLSFGHPYPAALDDCVKAYKHLVKYSKPYSVDSNRIGVAGEVFVLPDSQYDQTL